MNIQTKPLNAFSENVIYSKTARTISMKDGSIYRGLHATYLNGKKIISGLPFIKIQNKEGRLRRNVDTDRINKIK